MQTTKLKEKKEKMQPRCIKHVTKSSKLAIFWNWKNGNDDSKTGHFARRQSQILSISKQLSVLPRKNKLRFYLIFSLFRRWRWCHRKNGISFSSTSSMRSCVFVYVCEQSETKIVSEFILLCICVGMGYILHIGIWQFWLRTNRRLSRPASEKERKLPP